MSNGVYKRPINKLALLLSNEEQVSSEDARKCFETILYTLRPFGLGRRYVGMCTGMIVHDLSTIYHVSYPLLCNSQFFFVVVYSHIDHASLFLDHSRIILDHPPGT